MREEADRRPLRHDSCHKSRPNQLLSFLSTPLRGLRAPSSYQDEVSRCEDRRSFPQETSKKMTQQYVGNDTRREAGGNLREANLGLSYAKCGG